MYEPGCVSFTWKWLCAGGREPFPLLIPATVVHPTVHVWCGGDFYAPFLASLFMPKLSSEVPVGIVTEFADLTGNGAFKAINRACWRAAGELFRCVASNRR